MSLPVLCCAAHLPQGKPDSPPRPGSPALPRTSSKEKPASFTVVRPSSSCGCVASASTNRVFSHPMEPPLCSQGPETIVSQEVVNRRPSSNGSKGPSPPSSRAPTPPDVDKAPAVQPQRPLPTTPSGSSPAPSPAKASYRRSSSVKTTPVAIEAAEAGKTKPWQLTREQVLENGETAANKVRGVSANKKFLKNYNLEKFGLFAP